VSIDPPTAAAIARAVEALQRGELVAFPTETVYGLGADASNREAVAAIFAAKERPADHPVIVHLADSSAVDGWARAVPDEARAAAAAFWPGPLTLVLPRAARVGDFVTGGQDTVGLRVPAHPVALALLRAFAGSGDAGIAAPSANRFGHISPTTAAHVAAEFGDAVSMILDGGNCPVGIESTIVAFDAGGPVLLRPGGIGIDALTEVLGRPPRVADAAAPRAPGTLASHYAPRTRSRLLPPRALLAELERRIERDENPAVLARAIARPREFEGCWISAPADSARYARDLYASLRALDDAGADEILIEAPPAEADWLAVLDRLQHATQGEVDDRD